ncbi:hypothetical protein N656DRAFT_836594 [Canariomyces notabilis]|uniref:CHAT domain-containing protein n=1 Tax=Canariomyces notabilis TaxID=2074819 RepID=A0AAN6YT60_9PEZI|nr:hypothetical protein N656DRAFT_836594 [Canariomyces arenarius]
MDIQHALRQLGIGEEDMAAALSKLAIQVYLSYERTNSRSDIDLAVVSAQAAVDLTQEDDPDKLGRINNLGVMVASRYERTGAMGDLEETIGVARRAVAATPDDHPDHAACLNNLGNLLQPVAATPDEHPNRAGSRYERTGAMGDLDNACICLQQAWDTDTAVPFHRVQAAARCIKLLAVRGNISVATQLGQDVIHLLPTLNTKLLDRNDQQHVVSTFAGVAADLCSLHLASNRVDDALQYLEKGRAVILSQLIDSRGSVSDLARNHPDVARRYNELRDEVNAPLRILEQDAWREQLLERRRQSVLDFNVCIEQIRSLPGYERFLLGQTIAEMQECAAGGSIVVVNITEFRSDAIIITPAVVKAVNLSNLSTSEAETWLSKDWRGRRAERAAKNRDYLAYLAWLWKSCVEQILDEVRALIDLSANGLLRVWWIGSGMAGSMPFHAAGIHRTGSTETAYHRAVSSYAPSIKALAHAGKRAKETEATHGSLLAVSMLTTPAEKDRKPPPSLPGATLEKDKVLEVTKGRLPVRHLAQPSVDQVLEELGHCSVVHFACHGLTDHMDPSQSGLILQRQGEEQTESGDGAGPVQDRLTVARISELSLRQARLAYLSACSTAENRAKRLSDEVIHVVSGFLVAGFPHVVGCLWPSNDGVCVEMAGGFYSSLFEQGGSRWQDGQMAAALREAVMGVRVGDMAMPLNWAQFVHYGP